VRLKQCCQCSRKCLRPKRNLMRETRITAIFAFVAAVAAATVGVSHFLMPRAQLHFATGVTPAFFESLAARSGPFRIHYGAFVVAALASTAVVLGVRRLVAAPRPSAGRLGERWDRCFPGSGRSGRSSTGWGSRERWPTDPSSSISGRASAVSLSRPSGRRGSERCCGGCGNSTTS